MSFVVGDKVRVIKERKKLFIQDYNPKYASLINDNVHTVVDVDNNSYGYPCIKLKDDPVKRWFIALHFELASTDANFVLEYE